MPQLREEQLHVLRGQHQQGKDYRQLLPESGGRTIPDKVLWHYSLLPAGLYQAGRQGLPD
jgi:hypothetical protein